MYLHLHPFCFLNVLCFVALRRLEIFLIGTSSSYVSTSSMVVAEFMIGISCIVCFSPRCLFKLPYFCPSCASSVFMINELRLEDPWVDCSKVWLPDDLLHGYSTYTKVLKYFKKEYDTLKKNWNSLILEKKISTK